MSDYPYIVDIIVIAIIGLSALFGFIRGFLREVLSIGSWIVAGLAAWFGLPFLRPFARRYISHELFADVAAGIAIFLVVLVVASVIGHVITRSVRESSLGPLDRSLGILFGIARGAVIVSVALLICNNFYPPDNRPQWLKEARTLPAVEVGATIVTGIVRQFVPATVAAQVQSAADAAKQQAQPAIEFSQGIQIYTDAASNRPVADSAASTDDSGYNAADRKAMDRAMQQSTQ